MATGIKTTSFGGDEHFVYLLEAVVHDPENRNYLLHSDDLSVSATWSTTGVTVAASAKTDPDGTTLAWKITNDNVANGEFLLQILTATPVNPGWVLVFTVQADSSGGTATVIFKESGGAGADFPRQVRIVSGPGSVTDSTTKFVLDDLSNTEWTQVEVFYPEAPLTAAVLLAIYPGNSSTTTADVIHVWLPHLEKAAAANGLGFRSRGPRTTAATNGPDGADGQAVTVRAGTENYITLPSDSPANTVYVEGLIRPYTQNVSGGSPGNLIAGIATTSAGSFVLENASKIWDHLSAYDWRGRSLTSYRGLPGAAFSTFDQIYKGTSDGVFADDNTFSIASRDPLVEMDKVAEIPKFGGFGQCVRMDTAVTDYIDFGEVPAVWITGDLVVEARVRMYANDTNPLIIASYEGAIGAVKADNISWNARVDPFLHQMEVKWEFGSGSSESVTSATNSIPSADFSDGEWHYCAFIRNSATKQMEFFWDNAIIHTETYTDNADGGWNGTLRVGRDEAAVFGFTQDVDEVRIWATTRTEEELRVSKDTPFEPSQWWDKGLRAYYRMDEGLETRTWDEVTNLPERRMNESYLSFDESVPDYMQIANQADIQHASDFAIEVRVCTPDAGGGDEWIAIKEQAWRVVFNGTTMQTSIYTTPAAAWSAARTITYTPGEDGFVLLSLRWNETSKELAMFLDGGSKTTATLTGESINAATTDIFLAATAAAAGNSRQWISELRIWNGLRTDAEILAAANTILAGDETNLVLWHTFDEGRPKPSSLSAIEKIVSTGTDYALTTVYDRQHSDVDKKNSSNLSATFYDTSGTLQGNARFVGTGEGYRDLEGLRKPYGLGWVHNIPLILVDPINFVYHSVLGPIEEMTALREGGRELEISELSGLDDVWDYDFRDFPDSCRTLLNTTWTNKTTDAGDDASHDGDVPFLHATPASGVTGDGIYIGSNSKFTGVDLWVYKTIGNVDKQDTGADLEMSWQFWNGEAWENVPSLLDATDGMRLGGKNSWVRQLSARAGLRDNFVKPAPNVGKYFNAVSKIRFGLPETWVKESLNDIATATGKGSPGDSTDRWLIRFAATANATGYTAQPSVSAVWTLGVDAVVDLATGFVRLNSPPLYALTADVKADNTGGIWLDTASKVAKNMMERFGGWVSGDFASGFTSKGLDATVSGYTGLEDQSYAGVLRPIFADTRSILHGNRDGLIDVAVIADPTGASVSAELIEDEDHILSLAISRGASPASEIIYQYRRNYAELSERDLSLLLSTEDRTDILSRFRRHTHTFGLDDGTNFKEGEPQIVGGSISADSATITTISEAALWADMIGSDRRFYTVKIPLGVVEYTIGTLLGLRTTRYNLWDGTTTVLDSKPAYVLSFEEDAGQEMATLVLWG